MFSQNVYFLTSISNPRSVEYFLWNEYFIFIWGFFNFVCILQPNGVQKNLGLGKLSDYENQLLKAAIPELKKNIQKGEDFVNKKWESV